MQHWEVMGCALALLMASSCTIDDEDRCPTGFEFDTKYKFCFGPDPGMDSSSGSDVDTSTEILDSGPSDGGSGESTDTGSSVVETGIGSACESDEQCAGLVASYCVTSGGYCSIRGCAAGDCPDDYACCDCAGIRDYTSSACLTADSVAGASAIGCQCEE